MQSLDGGCETGGLQGQENRWMGLVVCAVLYERVKWLDVGVGLVLGWCWC